MGRDQAIRHNPTPWNVYDDTIRDTLGTYSRLLDRTPGFVPIEWQKVKAMLWTETSANDPAWLSAPMQCGVNNDPGLGDLLTRPIGEIIIPPAYEGKFNRSNVPHSPTLNIQAGCGVLLMRMSESHMVTDPDPPGLNSPVWFSPSQTSTRRALPQRTVAPQRVAKHQAITGWRPFTFEMIYRRYNGGGDGNYPEKLQHCYDIITGKLIL